MVLGKHTASPGEEVAVEPGLWAETGVLGLSGSRVSRVVLEKSTGLDGHPLCANKIASSNWDMVFPLDGIPDSVVAQMVGCMFAL